MATREMISDTYLLESIERVIRERVAAVSGKIIEKAQADIEEAIRAELGSVAIQLLKNYSIESNGAEITIRVLNQRT